MEKNNFFAKVFMWLFVGLAVSFGTSYYVSCNPNMVYNIFNNGIYVFLVIAELFLVIFLSARVHKMSKTTALITYILYGVVNGMTLSIIFLAYQLSSIVGIFGVSALVFLIFALLGYTTKMDLSKVGNILLIGLLSIIGISLINLFIGSNSLDIIITAVGVLIFVVYIAYDVNKIKKMTNLNDNYAIYMALELYLDFINLFIRLLRLFGKNRN